MRRVEIVRRPTPAERDRHVAFVDELAGALGGRPLSDHLWLDLLAGGDDGSVAGVVLEPGTPDRVLALAQVSAANEGSVLELVTRPGTAGAVGLDAVDTALDTVARTGGGRLTWWIDLHGDADDAAIRALAAHHDLRPARALHEMRRPLPHPDHATISTRSFVPGVDDDAWLAVNNRAFAEHGEQGGWTRDTLALRLAEPWFDPDGFRIHEIDGTIAAFCWTKIHSEHAPPIGEIYVIAVDPSAHGRGLGRQLTLAGLDAISERGVGVANLYVDAANTAAVRLYDGLGFSVHRTRTAFSGTLGAP
jgi:mycothiol synthase